LKELLHESELSFTVFICNKFQIFSEFFVSFEVTVAYKYGIAAHEGKPH